MRRQKLIILYLLFQLTALSAFGCRTVPDFPAQLYDLKNDIAEKNNLADKHPDIVIKLTALAEKARRDLGDLNRPGQNQRPPGITVTPVPLTM